MKATRSCWIVRASVCALAVIAAPAQGAPVMPRHVLLHVDWRSAGVGGVSGGAGTIVLEGVSGTVKQALLYWHGIDQPQDGGDGVYDNESITFAGHPIVGIPVGDSGPNCWPSLEDATGSSRSFRADVTHLVPGNGDYTLSGLSAKTGHSANGASLIVFFDDGRIENDRDVVVFEGNDSNVAGFPGEDDGWHAALSDIHYSGGSVNAEFHVADGQTFTDNSVTFTSTLGEVPVPDSETLWDGQSVTDAGTSRSEDGSLWDIHDLDVTGAFGEHATYTLSMHGQEFTDNDCLGLVVLVLDFPAGSVPPTTTTTTSTTSTTLTTTTTSTTSTVSTTIPPNPCGNGAVDPGEACDLGSANGTPGVCCSTTCSLLPAGQECRPAADACDVPETCDGSTTTCPADARRNVGDVCDDGDPETGISSCNAAQACTGVSTMVTLQPSIAVPPNKSAKRVKIPLTMQLPEAGAARAAVQAQGLVSCLDLPPGLRPAQCGPISRALGGRGAGVQSVFLPVTPRIRRSLGVTRSTSVVIGLPLTKLGRKLFGQLGFSEGGLPVRVRCLLRDRRGREIDVTAPTALQRHR